MLDKYEENFCEVNCLWHIDTNSKVKSAARSPPLKTSISWCRHFEYDEYAWLNYFLTILIVT